MLQSAKKYPDQPIISLGSKPYLSYRRMISRVQKGAATLRERFKLSPGDHVAIILRNSRFYLEIMYSCWFAGLAVVPVNAKLHVSEMAFIIENATIKLCFTSTELADILDSTSKPEVKFVDVSSKEYQEFFSHDSKVDMQTCKANDPAWLFYTSGTTGKPKGVVLTHGNLEALSASYFASVDSISPEDSILHAAPMSHASGFYNFPHVYAGANNIIPESASFDSREIFELTNEWKNTSLFVAPTMLMRMVSWAQKYHPNLEGIKTIVFGGGPMYVNDLLDAKKILGQRLAQIYAQGESPMMITSLSKWHISDDQNPRYLERIGSVGTPQMGVEVKIFDDCDRPLPVAEIGEIVVRSGAVMDKYWDNATATKETLRGGWLHTGDIGSLDKDGFLTLHDRSKDLIISGGVNIYPREVEEILLRHPNVKEVSVVGKKSAEWGEEVCAFVVQNYNDRNMSVELDELCLKNIARFKRPRHYRIVKMLPKNNYGKVLKTALRKLL